MQSSQQTNFAKCPVLQKISRVPQPIYPIRMASNNNRHVFWRDRYQRENQRCQTVRRYSNSLRNRACRLFKIKFKLCQLKLKQLIQRLLRRYWHYYFLLINVLINVVGLIFGTLVRWAISNPQSEFPCGFEEESLGAPSGEGAGAADGSIGSGAGLEISIFAHRYLRSF